MRSKAQFYLLECLENKHSRSSWFYFALLKALWNVLTICSCCTTFLKWMNILYWWIKNVFFFLLRDVSALLLTATEAFSVSHSLTQLGRPQLAIPVTWIIWCPKKSSALIQSPYTRRVLFKIYKETLVWACCDYARGFSSPPTHYYRMFHFQTQHWALRKGI